MKKIDQYLHNTYDIALKRRAKYIVNGLDLKGDERVLDVGCGDGFYLKLLKNIYPNLELYGIDNDKQALDVAYKNLEPYLSEIKIDKKGILESRFSDNYFDAVFASEVFEHIPDDLSAFREVKRILKPGGKLILTVPNYNFPFMWDPINKGLQILFNTHINKGFFAGIWNQHLRLYTLDKLILRSLKSGFLIADIKTVTHHSLPFHHYILNLGARLLHDTNLIQGNNKKSINKFEMSIGNDLQQPLLLRMYTLLVEKIDAKNTVLFLNQSSVSLYIKLIKQYENLNI